MHNSVNHSSPIGQFRISQNHAWVKKNPLTVQDKPTDFNVIDYEVIDMVSNTRLQLTFKNYYLSSFSIVSKK